MNMKSYQSISVAILVALSLYPPWAGLQNCNAQTNTNTVTNTNLYRTRINLVCTTTNANGNLVHDRVLTSEFVRECALDMGVTNLDGLTLGYNRSNNSLEVVNRTNREVICTPLSFAGGTSLANSNHTRVVLQSYVYFDTNSVASGLLSATQRLTYSRSGRLTSFGMRGSLYYNFNEGTNSPTICEGVLAVGSGISQRGGHNDNEDDDDDDNNGNTNGVIPGLGTTNANPGLGTITNIVPEFGTTNLNPGFGVTNINPGLGTTNINPGFSISNITPGFGTTNVNPIFGTTNLNPGFGTTNTNPVFGITNAISGFGTTNINSGFGTTNVNSGLGATNISPGFGLTNNPVFGTTNVNQPF